MDLNYVDLKYYAQVIISEYERIEWIYMVEQECLHCKFDKFHEYFMWAKS